MSFPDLRISAISASLPSIIAESLRTGGSPGSGAAGSADNAAAVALALLLLAKADVDVPPRRSSITTHGAVARALAYQRCVPRSSARCGHRFCFSAAASVHW